MEKVIHKSEANITLIRIISSMNSSFNLTNDYFQVHIYNAMRQENQLIETYRHIFGIVGSLFSIFGVFGNLISLVILLRPATSNLKQISKRKHGNMSSGSLNLKLQSFFTYLMALSCCDLFSCLFSILNVLEYIHPPYIDHDSPKYREFCLYVSIYTHPIVLTLQALSIWIICAFSMHRCRSIVRPSWFLKSRTKIKDDTLSIGGVLSKLCCCTHSHDESDDRNYLCHLKIKNNLTKETSLVEFYTRSISYLFKSEPNDALKCSYCFCIFAAENESKSSDLIENKQPQAAAMSSIEYEITTFSERPKQDKILVGSEHANKLRDAQLTMLILYVAAGLFMIPQFFEKTIIKVEVEDKEYLFPQITDFGNSKLFRQIFHLWFYIIVVYALPFILILVFNFMLLRAFLISRKKCLPYKMRKDPTHILRDMSTADQTTMLTVDLPSERQCSKSSLKVKSTLKLEKKLSVDESSGGFYQRQDNFKRNLKTSSEKICKRSRTLTLTLFGVVFLFGVCHLPSIISRILYVMLPALEFDNKKHLFFGLFTDFSNLLVMINSSLNFVLYIVFGPGKFRQEFAILFHTFCRCFGACYQKILKISSVPDNKCEIDSEMGYNKNPSRIQRISSLDFSDSKNNYGSTNDNIEEEDESV